MAACGTGSIAVVGGGPGGAHCARRLSEGGFDVTLFEPRRAFEKACGGGIPARGLARFPFLRSALLPSKTVRRCRVIAPSGREASIPLHDPLHLVSRADLHTFLLDRAARAGARLIRARVLSFTRDRSGAEARGARGGRGWLVSASPGGAQGPYDFLVAADGAAGRSRRRLASGLRADELTQGIGYYVPGLSEEFVTLKFFAGLDGYLWIFPRLDHSSAGICAGLGTRSASALWALLDSFLVERYGAAALRGSRRYGALIPDAPLTAGNEPAQGDGWACVGDASRAVDPLTREGIYYAMLAGEILATCLAAGRPERYRDAWARECGGEFAWAGRHARGFFEAGFVERLVTLCAGSPTVARVLSDLIAGMQPYRDLKRRLLLGAPRIALEAACAWIERPGSAAVRLPRDS